MLTISRMALLAVIFALAGCATKFPLMPVPAHYTGAQAKPLFTDAPQVVRTSSLDLLYITDRASAKSPGEPGPYTSERSRSMAFGTTTVLFGNDMTWDALVRQSTASPRSPALHLTLGPTKELGRYPPVPYAIAATEQGFSRTPAVIAGHEAATKALQAEVARRLDLSPRKELVLYVHGVANTFQDAALTAGELCHFLGREFVCAIFTWPAGGSKGLLFGYEVDYESSVFAAEHLRKALRTIAGTPGLERIHVLAHSRGTDVLVTALGDLNLEAYTQQTNVARRLKLGNVVLMAPDLDPGIFAVKLFKAISDPEVPYGSAPNPAMVLERVPAFHLTLYGSPDDKALATSAWIFGSGARLGRSDPALLTPEQIALYNTFGFIDFVQVLGKADLFGHSYFKSNPRASSDIIAMLRYGLRPNEPGRPLEEIQKRFWRMLPDGR